MHNLVIIQAWPLRIFFNGLKIGLEVNVNKRDLGKEEARYFSTPNQEPSSGTWMRCAIEVFGQPLVATAQTIMHF